jgi:hypothetical protein
MPRKPRAAPKIDPRRNRAISPLVAFYARIFGVQGRLFAYELLNTDIS